MDVCIVFRGTKLSGNATKDRNGSIQIKIYNDKFQEHIVKYYMWDIFYLPYPTDKTKSWDFSRLSPDSHWITSKISFQSERTTSIEYIIMTLKAWSGVDNISTTHWGRICWPRFGGKCQLQFQDQKYLSPLFCFLI